MSTGSVVGGVLGGIFGGPIGGYLGSKLGGSGGGDVGDGVNGHGGFTGPGYGAPNSPGFDEHGLPLEPEDIGAGNYNNGLHGNPRENAFEWGGTPGYAAQDRERYRGIGDKWGSQAAPTTDYSGGDRYMGYGDQSRAGGVEGLGMIRDRALGNGPSAAEIMMQRGAAANAAATSSLAAGARGPAALALAQQNAAANLSAGNANNVANVGMLRAKEQADAQNALVQGYNNMRGQDFQGGGLHDARSQYRSGLEMDQRRLGLQGQLAYEQLGYNVNNAQMAGQMGKYGAQDDQHALQVNTDMASRRADDSNYQTIFNGIMSKSNQSKG